MAEGGIFGGTGPVLGKKGRESVSRTEKTEQEAG